MAAQDSASELSAEEAEFHASKIIPSWELGDPGANGAHANGHEAEPRPRSVEEAETVRALAEPSGARSPDTIIEPVDAVSPDEVQITDDEPIAAQPVVDVGGEPAVVKSEPPLATTKPSVSKPPGAKPGRGGKTRIGMGADVETPASPVVEPPAVSKTRPDEAPPAGAPRKAKGGTLVMDEPAKKPARKTPVTRSDADAPAPVAASKSFGGADEEVELPVGGDSKGLGMKIGLGLVAVVAIGLGIKFLSGSSDSPAPAPTTPAHTVEAAPPPPPPPVTAAPAPTPAPTPEPPAATATAAPAESAAPTASAVAAVEPPKKAEKPEKPVVEKPVAEKPVKASANKPPAAGNKPAAPSKGGGGVIIKETPF